MKVCDFGIASVNQQKRAVHASASVSGSYQSSQLDIGISDLSGGERIVGTPKFMPPELWDPKSSVIGPKSDVFSLGLVAWSLFVDEHPYEIMARVAPYEKLKGLQLLSIMSRLDIPIPSIRKYCPDIPRILADIINQALITA